MKILKFGGTSMGNAAAITKAAHIIISEYKKDKEMVIVVSAMGGVTDQLFHLLDLAERKKTRLISSELIKIKNKHKKALKSFIFKKDLENIWQKYFEIIFNELETVLTSIKHIGKINDKTRAKVSAFGEKLSSWLMYFALKNLDINVARYDTSKYIKTDDNYLEANIDFPKTRNSFKKNILPDVKKGKIAVLTGFIGGDIKGNTTLLGRGGSDYTAAIAAVSLDADEVQIWSDVAGIMSADPKKIKNPIVWDKLSFQVASELAHSGARVLYPKTITPAVKENIPIFVRDTFHPEKKGTMIVRKNPPKGLKGIISSKGQTILHLTSPSIVGEPGFIKKSSEIFEKYNISIDVCATSEISVTFSIETSPSLELIEEFKKFANVEVIRNIAKISLIGYGISSSINVLGELFPLLKGIKIYTVSQGASFHNITFLVGAKDSNKILRILHKHFFENGK